MDSSLSRIITALLTDGAPIPRADLDAVAGECPFFTLPALEALRRGGDELDDDTRCRLTSMVALNAPDARSLFMLLSPHTEALRSFYPPEHTTVTTDDAITKFLDTYGSSDPAQEALLERLIFNPVPPDYMAMLEQEEAGRPEPVAPLREPEPADNGERPLPPSPSDSSLSESLAKIYIRQHRYDKAFEIIHNLSLNNPKKSAYFADQLRFLAKLMLVTGQQPKE